MKGWLSSENIQFYSGRTLRQEEGVRLPPSANFETYSTRTRALQERFNALVDEFVQRYEQSIRTAKASLKKLFDPDDYPPREIIRQSFSMEFRIEPVPSGEALSVVLKGSDKAQPKKVLTESNSKREREAMKHLYARLAKGVFYFFERLDPPELLFRYSLISI